MKKSDLEIRVPLLAKSLPEPHLILLYIHSDSKRLTHLSSILRMFESELKTICHDKEKL